MTSRLNTVTLWVTLSLVAFFSTPVLAQEIVIEERDNTPEIDLEQEQEQQQEQASQIYPDRPLKSFYWGFRFGQGIGYPDINLDPDFITDDRYTNGPQAASSFGALFVEKRIHPYFHVHAGAEVNFSQRILVSEDSAASTFSGLVGAGATIGNVTKPFSPYISFMVGPGVTKISDTGDNGGRSDPCDSFFCFSLADDALGASASGISSRVSIGMSTSPQFRVALSQTVIGGDADDLPSGSTAFTRYTYLMITAAIQ